MIRFFLPVRHRPPPPALVGPLQHQWDVLLLLNAFSIVFSFQERRRGSGPRPAAALGLAEAPPAAGAPPAAARAKESEAGFFLRRISFYRPVSAAARRSKGLLILVRILKLLLLLLLLLLQLPPPALRPPYPGRVPSAGGPLPTSAAAARGDRGSHL